MTELLKKLSLILNGEGSSNLPAQEFYHTLALVSPVGIFQTDAEGRCVYVNERWCEFTGLSPAEAVGQERSKALHPDDRERVAGSWEASVESDRIFKVDYRFQRPDDKITWVHGESTPITDDTGGITGYVGTVTDVTDRMEAEIRLENAQHHLRGILDNSTEAIISISESQHITFFNQSAELLFGYKEAEVLGEPLDILLPRETMQRHAEHIKRFGAGDRDSRWMNNRMPIAGVRKDGTRFVAQASIARFDLHGEHIYSVMMRDMTREIEAEEDLEKSESSLAEAQRIGRMGNWDWDIVADKLAWSDEIYRIFGLEPQEFGATYEAFLNSVYPEDRDFVKKSVEGALAGEPYDIDHRVITSWGEVRHVHEQGEVVFNETGLPVRMVGVVQDITERKLAEEALVAERERLAITLRSITDGVITTDADGKVVLINRAGEELIGRSQEESAGRPLEEIFRLVHETTGEPLEIPLSKVLLGENGAASENQAILISRDGDCIPVEEGASPLRDKDSRIIGMVLVFRDRSDRIRLESEIQRGQKLESLGELAGGLAHDFNNFLMGINLKVSTAELKARHDPDLRELLKSAQDSIQRARGITQQLLTFARGGEPVKTVLDFRPFLKEAVKFAIHGSRVVAHFRLNEGLWPIEIDQGQMNQVLNNLVINAVQAMPKGGELKVNARNIIVDGNNPHYQLAHGPYVEVAVQDNGVGIPENIIDNIFDPYFTTRSQGSGLGLFSCYSIVDKHGGWMTVESEVDQGSTFTFYLPASRKNVVEASSAGEVVAGTGHILVVDDEETIRSGMEELLEVLDYQVRTAPDGEEGLALYHHYLEIGEPFDLVILDLTIPGAMAGEEIAWRLREITPDLKMIVASGYSTDPIMAHYRDYGFQGVLVKPFSAEELSQILVQLLGSD